MSPAPDFQPRDRDGRFGHREQTPVHLDLVETPNARDVQERSYAHAWNTAHNTDAERAEAVRSAITAARTSDPDLVNVLGPDPEALSHLEDALHDDDTLLDAVHTLGPLPHPQDRNFGPLVAGAAYDLWTTRREDDIEAGLGVR